MSGERKKQKQYMKSRYGDCSGIGIKELDLHGIKHNDVQSEVENFVLLNNPPLKIITGMSDKMKELVTEVLERNEMMYDIPYYNNGMVKILNY